jgi:hypothetical protein
VSQGRHIGPLFFINNVDEVFRMFQHVYALGYADDLKLFKTIESIDDCHRFQSGLDRLQEWCSGRKFGLNAAKCRSIFLNINKKPIGFDYRIGGNELRTLIKDLDIILDTRMSFLSHVETIISKSARMLGFIKHISREFNDHYTDKALFVSLVRQNLEYGPL